MIYIEYIILSLSVIGFSIYLSKYVDLLDKKSNLSGAFIGGILLAAVTSLPEFVTSLTAIFALNQPDLVQGNVFGSNIFNLGVLGGCILIFTNKFNKTNFEKTHKKSSIYTIIIYILCLIGININKEINLGILNLNIISLIILIMYILFLFKTDNKSAQEINNNEQINLSVQQILYRFIIFSILLVIASIMLTNVTDKLNEKLNLGTTIGGAIFLGIATSLPELTSSFNLVRLGNFNAAFANIIGSNLFNFTILSISDIFYMDGNIFSKNLQTYNLIVWGIIATILCLISIIFNKKKSLCTILSILIISCYLSSIMFSIK